MNQNIIDFAQLHGEESESYIHTLRKLTDKPILKAFSIKSEKEVTAAEESSADLILLDSGAGTGTVFDWSLVKRIARPYFLAGGLDVQNVADAIQLLAPYAVDVSSGIETNGRKEKKKMLEFSCAVRKDVLK